MNQGGEKTQGPDNRFSRLRRLPDQLTISEGLELKRIEEADLPRLFDIIERNPDIRERVAWASKVRAAEDVLPSLQRYSNEDMDGRFVIVGEGDVVGYIGIHPSRHVGEYGIGYFLDSAARGRGYVTNAVRSLTEQAKLHLDAEQIYLQIVPDNAASRAVPERLGFHKAETVMGVDFPVEQQRWRLDLSQA